MLYFAHAKGDARALFVSNSIVAPWKEWVAAVSGGLAKESDVSWIPNTSVHGIGKLMTILP